jgi:hypothetical protein
VRRTIENAATTRSAFERPNHEAMAVAGIRPSFILRGLAVFAGVVLGVGLLAAVVFRETYSPGLKELAGEPVWEDLPSGSAVWESASSHNDCDRSEQREYRQMGLFVVDRDEALQHYEDVLHDGGWSVEPIETAREGQLVLRATKPGEHALLAVSVTASDRRGVQDIKDGKLVPEGRPDGFDQESDYVSIWGTPEPQCES